MSRIFTVSVASVYPHYVTKIEKKGRTTAELHQVIEWLTGFDEVALAGHLASGTTFEDFFAAARLNPRASAITGSVCGVRVQDVEDPLMQKIRYLDKLVDELAKGRPMEKVLRTQRPPDWLRSQPVHSRHPGGPEATGQHPAGEPHGLHGQPAVSIPPSI